jgi:G:T/U-mismatch repair DNA glycosylase
MLPEIIKPDLTVIFVGAAVTELSESLGFYHLHPKDRFWELLAIGSITPKHVITAQERKALANRHKSGSLSDPVRQMFTQKRADQLLKLGIGLRDLNRRTIAVDEKDKSAKPNEEDVHAFIARVATLNPRALAFVMREEDFVGAFKRPFPVVTDTLGLQAFKIGNAEVWLLGPTTAVLRGESLSKQEDAFFALGERILAVRGGSSQPSPPALDEFTIH